MPDDRPRSPCTVDNCGHMRQLDAIVDLLEMHRGGVSVLDFLRARKDEVSRLTILVDELTARQALGAFEVLRRLGFRSDDIFFHQNMDEPPGPEPRGMMFVVLQTQGKEFSIRVGVVDLPYAEWAVAWKAVATAALDKRIAEADRIVEESEAFRDKVRLMMAIQGKGIRLPAAQRHLS